MSTFKEIFSLVLFGVISVTSALEPYDNFSEGSCHSSPIRSVPFNRDVLNTWKYLPAGSRYHMYRMASVLPNYRKLREHDFYYDFCYSRTPTVGTNTASSFGFGRLLSTFRLSSPPGTYLELEPIQNHTRLARISSGHGGRRGGRRNAVRLVVTLTDNKNFAFLSNCWTGDDERSWSVLSRTPNLDARTRQLIEKHAIAQGFKRENFVYLNYDSCRGGQHSGGDARRGHSRGHGHHSSSEEHGHDHHDYGHDDSHRYQHKHKQNLGIVLPPPVTRQGGDRKPAVKYINGFLD